MPKCQEEERKCLPKERLALYAGIAGGGDIILIPEIPCIVARPLEETAGKLKPESHDHYRIETARPIGICIGDE